jgi:hypothetical protein
MNIFERPEIERPTVNKVTFDATKPLSRSILTSTRAVTFHETMIDKTGPGERTHELHIGRTDLETKALLMAQGGVEEVIARMAIDLDANRLILRKMFPSKEGGYVDTTNPHYTATSLQDDIRTPMSGFASGSDLEIASMLYVSFMADLLNGTSVIQPSKPLVCTTRALNTFVSPDVIREQVRVNSIMNTLDSANLQLNLGRIRRLTPKYFLTEACRALGNLGMALLENKKHDQYLQDSFLLVRYFHDPEARDTLLPVDLRDDINLKSLASNLSFALASVTTVGGIKLHTPAHALKDALRYVVSVLKKSPRMDIIPMEHVKKYMSHMQIKDPKDQIVGSVVWRNMNGNVRTQATRFIPMNSKETIHFQQPQRLVEEVFDSIGSNLFKNIDGHKIGRLAHEVLSNVATNIEKPYGLTIGLDGFDVMHYACAVADATYLRYDTEDSDAAIPVQLVYEVHHNDHYLGSVGTYGEKSILTSPVEAITLASDNVQVVEIMPRVQGVKDDARTGFYFGDPNLRCTKLGKDLVYNFKVKGKARKLKIPVQDLLGVFQSATIAIHEPIVNSMVLSNYCDTLTHLLREVKLVGGGDTGINVKALELLVAMHVNKILASVYSGAAGKALANSVIFKILETLPKEDLEVYKLDLYRAESQIDMLVWTSLIMMMKMGIVNYDQVKQLRNIITQPAMTQYLLASTDFDFKEI